MRRDDDKRDEGHGASDIVAALTVWRNGLVNLTGVNRLINFKHSKTGTLQITAPSAQQILEGLRTSRTWGFVGTSDTETKPTMAQSVLPANTLRSPKDDKDIGPVLRSLLRRSKQEYLDRGLSVLYIAMGMLEWRDVDETAYASPLLLIPVDLTSTGPRDTPRLQAGEDDPVLNPALALRLQDFGVTLPTVESIADLNLATLFDEVRHAVRARKGWTVTDAVVLSHFSFHKEAMYRDLLANEALVLDHPVVRAIATQDPNAQTDNFFFDEIKPEDIDRDAPPEDTPLVLDADSSQRACVAAAIAGRSFVMDGPPGTGKSQTIANMIGALLHAGKTVLFVSEKAAALDVVRNRLEEAGLDNYLLELHSHKASRKEVATALAHALDNVPVAPAAMDTLSRKILIERRHQLNAYAKAMNQTRDPLGYSLHEVLGQIANLEHVPAAPTPDRPPVNLTPDMLHSIREASDRIHRAWRPASQGRSYLWREVTDKSSLSSRLYQAGLALEELVGIVSHNRPLTDAFEITRPSEATPLAALLSHSACRPAAVHDDWLTVADLTTVYAVAAHLAKDLAGIRNSANAARTETGVDWTALPDPITLPTTPSVDHLTPAPVNIFALDAATADELGARFAADADLLSDRVQALNGLTAMLQLAPVSTIRDADTVLAIAGLAYTPHRPLRQWLSPDGIVAAQAAATALRERVTTLGAAETAAHRFYTDAALNEPLADLHERFTNVHKGLRKLFPDYRRDKKAVAAFTAEMVSLEDAIADLGVAVEWSQARTDLTTAETHHATALGSYWQQRGTDFTDLDEALAHAELVLRLTPANALAAVTDHVCAADPAPAVEVVIEGIRADLDLWCSALAQARQPGAQPELLLVPLAAAVDWLRGHLTPLRQSAERARAVSVATDRALTLSQANEALLLREAAKAAEATLAGNAGKFEASLGALAYQGKATDESALSAALAWAKETRSIRNGTDSALTQAQVKALSTPRYTDNLPAANAKWQTAARHIVDAFATTRHVELDGELDDYADGATFLTELRDDSSGQDEWFAYQEARVDLAVHGLDSAVGFCIDQAIPAAQVRAVVDRALLRAWADQVIAQDKHLHPLRAEDRTALVEEYKRLDRQLIPAATADIIRAVNSRRPASTDVGEPGVIRREGMKKTRHLPVRELIKRSRNATLAIKPCFMMSPLAVSQYLPADMTFDVVIFDEASQVTPGDAINCIYRGKALITAGDDKQLPPTSFFDRMSDAEGDEDAATDVTDFQSILELSKACGAFRNLGLRWHYRSRHEALIAFSNHSFYEGKLVTYPGAHSEGPDVGVELFHVPGSYRRGTSADNPIEAAHVAARVIHHFTTRPDTTLGVVTFSVAQADAIQSALDRALEDRPDLEGHTDGDRLHGFFIKSLESVQGDERDVMIFSIGYGPDEHGKITSNFGALNKSKGWRRLNVAITRARQRVEIVTSIRAGDVPSTENESVRYLASYLDYAERGMDALTLQLGPSGLGTESPFEDSVIDAIRSRGFLVEPQVGAAGYRIDMGVRHPAHPGVFALGIECDGYMYHSSPAARDRDRLREQVLRGLGWNLHRIWGTSWYRNRKQEEERLIAAIDAAIAAPIHGRLSGLADDISRPIVTTAEIERPAIPPWTTPYEKATVSPLPRWIDASDPGSRFDMISGIEEIARVEGPVHIDVVHQRLRDAWNIGRVGVKIRENIEAAIDHAEVIRRGGPYLNDEFIDVPDRLPVSVRIPGDGVGRTVEQISEEELATALRNLVRDGGTVSRDDLMTATARVYGWNRRGTDITARLSLVVNWLLADGTFTEDSAALSLPSDE